MRKKIEFAAMGAWIALSMVFGAAARGQAAPAGDALAARAQLSEKLLAGGLDRAQENAVVKKLTALARQTVFSAKVVEGDPVAFSYTVKEGDTIERINRRLGLNLPISVVEQINGNCGSLTPGRTLKLLRGPFRAVISKSKFSMYVYLEAPDGQRVVVRRVKVAIGKNDGTPEGSFRIAGKAKHVTWTPPASMAKKYKRPVKWGQKGYPLGKEGYFMTLRGTDGSTSSLRGYGIHGTNAQWSIGKAASHGCIRVGDGDIGPLWGMMTEGASTIEILP
jgi:lipoprotein-anchoring transpeptidase ErfK/SrfK